MISTWRFWVHASFVEQFENGWPQQWRKRSWPSGGRKKKVEQCVRNGRERGGLYCSQFTNGSSHEPFVIQSITNGSSHEPFVILGITNGSSHEPVVMPSITNGSKIWQVQFPPKPYEPFAMSLHWRFWTIVCEGGVADGVFYSSVNFQRKRALK